MVISRLVYRKGIDLLARLIPIICRSYPNIEFLIGGDGPKRALLQQVIDTNRLHRRVRLIGAVRSEQARELLIQGDIFLNSSLTEAFCIAIVEAASCGLQVVTTNVGGIPEVLPPELIWLAPPSVDGLVQGLRRAIEHRQAGRVLCPLEAHNRVRRFYRWSNVANRTKLIYDSLFAGQNEQSCDHCWRSEHIPDPDNEEENERESDKVSQVISSPTSSATASFSKSSHTPKTPLWQVLSDEDSANHSTTTTDLFEMNTKVPLDCSHAQASVACSRYHSLGNCDLHLNRHRKRIQDCFAHHQHHEYTSGNSYSKLESPDCLSDLQECKTSIDLEQLRTASDEFNDHFDHQITRKQRRRVEVTSEQILRTEEKEEACWKQLESETESCWQEDDGDRQSSFHRKFTLDRHCKACGNILLLNDLRSLFMQCWSCSPFFGSFLFLFVLIEFFLAKLYHWWNPPQSIDLCPPFDYRPRSPVQKVLYVSEHELTASCIQCDRYVDRNAPPPPASVLKLTDLIRNNFDSSQCKLPDLWPAKNDEALANSFITTKDTTSSSIYRTQTIDTISGYDDLSPSSTMTIVELPPLSASSLSVYNFPMFSDTKEHALLATTNITSAPVAVGIAHKMSAGTQLFKLLSRVGQYSVGICAVAGEPPDASTFFLNNHHYSPNLFNGWMIQSNRLNETAATISHSFLLLGESDIR